MAGSPLDVAQLAAVARGEPEAARALVEHCHPLVMRIVRAHRPRTVPEEDLAQEVYLKMFGRLDRYEPREGVPFEHWLSRLAADRGKQVPPLGVLGATVLLLMLVSAVFGLAGLARRVGAGLPSPLDEAQPWRSSLRGGLVLAATFLLPFGGWFVLLPCALVSGFGVSVMAWRQRGPA
jgi:hypothetical protein